MGSTISIFSDFDDTIYFSNHKPNESLENDDEKHTLISKQHDDDEENDDEENDDEENDDDEENEENEENDDDDEENKTSQPTTKTTNKNHIYLLLKDNELVCFSPNKCDLMRTLHVYKYNYMISGGKFRWDEKHETTNDDIILNVYERNLNFLFGYNRLIVSFNIIKIPHFRTSMFNKMDKNKGEKWIY
jgi:hypothetical protein